MQWGKCTTYIEHKEPKKQKEEKCKELKKFTTHLTFQNSANFISKKGIIKIITSNLTCAKSTKSDNI